ncbi:hypothetical protein [Aquipuribacter nitratireducens]|uniref:DNA-directed RNA polymerase subunit beta n=1 Tax=Aquipuribacter nitratireducens TaxID=650104 RepID=A0ABW0GKU5_9MICO
MTHRPRRPAPLSPAAVNALSDSDPAERLEAAHASAHAVVARLRDGSDPEAGARMAAAVDTDEGLDAAARLWAVAAPVSLPGGLWRLLALRAGVRRAPAQAAREFDAGRSRLPVSEVVAGVAQPPGPDEVSAMVDAVLLGVGAGDLDVTFERAAAFARVCSVGRAVLADRRHDDEAREDSVEALDAELDAARLTRSASALVQTAEHLEACARRWRRNDLD